MGLAARQTLDILMRQRGLQATGVGLQPARLFLTSSYYMPIINSPTAFAVTAILQWRSFFAACFIAGRPAPCTLLQGEYIAGCKHPAEQALAEAGDDI